MNHKLPLGWWNSETTQQPPMSHILTEDKGRKKLTDEDEVMWKESNVTFV